MPNTEKVLPKKTILKRIRNLFLWIFLLCVFIFISLPVLLFFYRDEIKAILLRELNKNLKAEVVIAPQDIDITIIKTFPDCSLELKRVLMLEALPGKQRDTLMFVRQLNLNFNLIDIWNKKYEIKSIKIKDGIAKPEIFENGKNNFSFWKSDTSSQSNTDSLKFKLNEIRLEKIIVIYTNRQNRFYGSGILNDVLLNGNFSVAHFDLKSNGSLALDKLRAAESFSMSDKNVTYVMEIKTDGKKYIFKNTKIGINDLALELEGSFVYGDALEKADCDYSTGESNMQSLLSLLPSELKNKISDYKSEGYFLSKGKINYSARKGLNFESDFRIKNGAVIYKPNSVRITDLNTEGKVIYSSKKSLLKLNSFSLNLQEHEMSGNFEIAHFENPEIRLALDSKIKLESALKFFPVDTISEVKGEMALSAELQGLWHDIKNNIFSHEVKLSLKADVKNFEIKFKRDEKPFAVETCSLFSEEGNVEVNGLKIIRHRSDVLMNGKISGLFDYLTKKKNLLAIRGNLFSENLYLEDFVHMSQDTSANTSEYLIPQGLELDLQSGINNFHFRKFTAGDVNARIEIKNRKAIAENASFEVMDGRAELNLFADNSDKNLELTIQSRCHHINITQLFSQLNNFGQNSLTDKNIRGSASANIDFTGIWDNKLDVKENSIKANCQLSVEGGELLNFKPLESLSRFVDVKDLQHIKFSSLQSDISIKDKTITLSKTDIRNSALDINIWGSQNFNYDMDYHIQLLISDLLNKKRKPSDVEFGPAENDRDNRRSAFVLMTGNIDHPVFKYDRKGLKEKIKNDMKQEKQTLKNILKEEFGWFNKDTLKKSESKKASPKFELEKENKKKKKKEEDEEDF